MNDSNKKTLALAVLWLLLLTMPYWMGAVGGYTGLATRVLVLGLAAMSVNFLLGFTGVLSFGHAAYFGLGAYGAGMLLLCLHLGHGASSWVQSLGWRHPKYPADRIGMPIAMILFIGYMLPPVAVFLGAIRLPGA